MYINDIKKLEYRYQHCQDHQKVYEKDTHVTTHQSDDALYPQVNNDIEYGLFVDVIGSYYLNSHDFACTKTCYNHNHTNNKQGTDAQCTHACDHISQPLQSLAYVHQQHNVYTIKMGTSLCTTYTSTPCTFNVITSDPETDTQSDHHNSNQKTRGTYFYSKHKYRNNFGDSHIQYHDFDNGDTLNFTDKYTALL